MNNYSVEIGGKSFDVIVEEGHVVVDGERMEVSLSGRPGDPVRKLIAGSGVVPVAVERGEQGWSVTLAGDTWDVSVADHRDMLLRQYGGAAAAGARGGQVKAPMPGLVLRVLVSPGDEVQPETGVLVLEAMKMENEVASPSSGEIVDLRVEPGDTVAAGQVIAIVK